MTAQKYDERGFKIGSAGTLVKSVPGTTGGIGFPMAIDRGAVVLDFWPRVRVMYRA